MSNCNCNSISLLTNKDLVLDGVVFPSNRKECGCETNIVDNLTFLPKESRINIEKGDV